MNDGHINEKELQQYGESELPPGDFLRVQTHLETCEDCRRRLDEMFPNIAETEESLLIEDLQESEADDFHLNYDEHLKPFIYETIDEADREIIESHIEVCAACREDLRDLFGFHEELEREREIRELSKAIWWTHLTNWFAHPNRKAVWLVCAAILIFIGSGLAWVFLSKPVKEIAQNQTDPGIFQNNRTVPEIKHDRPPPETNQNPVAPRADRSIAQNQTAVKSPKEIESSELVMPKFLNELQIKEYGMQRGNGDSPLEKIIVISPNETAIRDSAPVLKWQNIPNIHSYEIGIFDENDNRVEKIETVSGNSQRVSNLPKGKIYHWQVSAKNVAADGRTINFLGQAKFYIISDRDERRIGQAKGSLEKGKALAEAGLLREAARELRKFLVDNPNSETAKKWLNQILQKR